MSYKEKLLKKLAKAWYKQHHDSQTGASKFSSEISSGICTGIEIAMNIINPPQEK